jgi:ABC-type sulfate transport system substrate-binding protein
VIESFKTKLAEFVLAKKVAKTHRKVKAKGFREAKHIGIVYPFTPEGEKIVRDFAHYIKDERMKVDTLGYVYSKEHMDNVISELSYHYFEKKTLSWLYTPIDRKVIAFLEKEYDILIDLSIKDYFPVKYLTSLSVAHFKVGAAFTYRNSVCDLTIDISKQKDLNYLIQQLKHYLNLIN